MVFEVPTADRSEMGSFPREGEGASPILLATGVGMSLAMFVDSLS